MLKPASGHHLGPEPKPDAEIKEVHRTRGVDNGVWATLPKTPSSATIQYAE
jgi:hypothetical protein